MFYANPKPVKQLRVNQFLRVEPPEDSLLQQMHEQMEKFSGLVNDGELELNYTHPEEMNVLYDLIKDKSNISSIDTSVEALIAYQNSVEDLMSSDEEEDEPDNVVSLFSNNKLSDEILSLYEIDDAESFCKPFIRRNYMRKSIRVLERVLGRDLSHAKEVAKEIVDDFADIMSYEEIDNVEIDESAVLQSIQNINKEFLN